MTKFFIIAADYHQALHWTNINKKRMYDRYQVQPGEMQYLKSVETIMGIDNPRGMFIGTWYRRKDIDEVIHYLLVRMTTQEKQKAIMKVRDFYLSTLRGAASIP